MAYIPESIIVLIAFLLAWFTAQGYKFFTTRPLSLQVFIHKSGGMPSSHAASIVSLATAIFLLQGLSTLFVVVFVIALLFLRDAYGVRYATGHNARILADLSEVRKKRGLGVKIEEGHTLKQVIYGCVLGFVVASIIVTVLTLWCI